MLRMEKQQLSVTHRENTPLRSKKVFVSGADSYHYIKHRRRLRLGISDSGAVI